MDRFHHLLVNAWESGNAFFRIFILAFFGGFALIVLSAMTGNSAITAIVGFLPFVLLVVLLVGWIDPLAVFLLSRWEFAGGLLRGLMTGALLQVLCALYFVHVPVKNNPGLVLVVALIGAGLFLALFANEKPKKWAFRVLVPLLVFYTIGFSFPGTFGAIMPFKGALDKAGAGVLGRLTGEIKGDVPDPKDPGMMPDFVSYVPDESKLFGKKSIQLKKSAETEPLASDKTGVLYISVNKEWRLILRNSQLGVQKNAAGQAAVWSVLQGTFALKSDLLAKNGFAPGYFVVQALHGDTVVRVLTTEEPKNEEFVRVPEPSVPVTLPKKPSSPRPNPRTRSREPSVAPIRETSITDMPTMAEYVTGDNFLFQLKRVELKGASLVIDLMVMNQKNDVTSFYLGDWGDVAKMFDDRGEQFRSTAGTVMGREDGVRMELYPGIAVPVRIFFTVSRETRGVKELKIFSAADLWDADEYPAVFRDLTLVKEPEKRPTSVSRDGFIFAPGEAVLEADAVRFEFSVKNTEDMPRNLQLVLLDDSKSSRPSSVFYDDLGNNIVASGGRLGSKKANQQDPFSTGIFNWLWVTESLAPDIAVPAMLRFEKASSKATKATFQIWTSAGKVLFKNILIKKDVEESLPSAE